MLHAKLESRGAVGVSLFVIVSTILWGTGYFDLLTNAPRFFIDLLYVLTKSRKFERIPFDTMAITLTTFLPYKLPSTKNTHIGYTKPQRLKKKVKG